MYPNLPNLKILSLDTLIPHEDHDHQRTHPLVGRLRAEGILHNPPIVTPLQDGSGRHVVLDGINRVTALKTMQLPHVIAQVVQANDPQLKLYSWNHIVWGMGSKEFIRVLRKTIDSYIQPEMHQIEDRQAQPVEICIQLPDHKALRVQMPPNLSEQVSLLQNIVGIYRGQVGYNRSNHTQIESFKELYPNLTGLILFPNLDIHNVLILAGSGQLLPSGITRFIVTPRALHVNYPLDELASARPLDEKTANLKDWLQKRLREKNVRYYAEATFLFDD